MPEALVEQPEATAPCAIPRWGDDFDLKNFDLQAVLREAAAQKKSAGALLKSLGYPVAELVGAEGNGTAELKSTGGIPVSASSTAQDLAGDDFDLAALKQMSDAALGTTVFLNHEYIVPEDVYGKVASVEINTRRALDPLSNQTRNITFLDMSFDPVGDEENPRAVQVTNMLRKSQLRLGVSVTVLVLAYKDREDGGRTITRVYYLECSIVGIPCNQTAWVKTDEPKSFSPAATATKSLTDMTGTEPKSAAITGASGAAAEQPETTSQKSAFWAAAILASKAMFADVLEDNRNNYWILSDSFRTVYHRLLREARGKSGESLTTLVNEANASVDEFAEELKQLLATEINEAATQETTSSPYYEWWSAIGRLQGLVQKSGARNSKSDQALLNKAHDCIVEAGGTCSHGEAAAETEGGGGTKQASLGDADTKTAALALKVAQLESERDAAVEMAETLATDLADEREVSKSALDALEELSREPLPRAGA